MTLKFLKFIYMYMVGALSFTPICSCSHSHNISLSGGSVSLSGKPKTKGEDSKQWKLTINGEVVVDKDAIQWKLISPTNEKLPDTISINDGIVSWTDQIEAGTYNFYVSAIYDNNQFNSDIITLLIFELILKYDGDDLNENFFYYDKFSGKEPKTSQNWYLYDNFNKMNIPSYLYRFDLECFGYKSVFNIDKNGFLSWNESIVVKDFNFQIKCCYNNIVIYSKIYTLSVIDTSNFYFSLNNDESSYTIMSFDKIDYGNYDKLILPPVYNNLTVNTIGDNFLSGCSAFNPTNFQIPSTITSIGDNFLSGCSAFNLTDFQIPNTITSIGDGFLSGCSAFNPTNFQIPNTITSIGDGFLSGCSAFNPTNFQIPYTIISIGDNFLSGCSAFNPTNFEIPSITITSIGDNFLSGCSAFNPKDFQIPNTITSIGDGFLSGCSAFNPTNFEIPSYTINSIGDNFLSGCSAFNPTNFKIPSYTITSIGDNFLSGCSAFNPTDFQIPNTITSIGDGFLSGCSAFNPTDFQISNTITSIGDGFLSGCSAFNPTNFEFHSITITSIGDNFLSGCSAFNPTNFEFPSITITSIGDNFLSGCSAFNPKDFKISEGIKHVGAGFLHNCYSLVTIIVMATTNIRDCFVSSDYSLSVDDDISCAYTKGVTIYVQDKIMTNWIPDFFYKNINDYVNKIFRKLKVEVSR